VDESPARPATTGSPNDISRFGLFLGPALLASYAATGIVRVVCDGRSSLVESVSFSPVAPVFFFFVILLPLRRMDPLMRAGLIGFALWQALQVYVWLTENRLPNFAGWIGVICAVLFTAAGLRASGRHRIAIAVSVFIVVFGFSAFTQRLARDMVGRTSIMSDSFFCRS
jgi:hypothetical protein